MFGGGNGERNFSVAASDESFSPQTFAVEHDEDLRPVLYRIEATPTPAAIAPTVTGGQPGSGSQVVQAPATEVASSNLAPSLTGCPAVIVETFGENAPAACAVAWCESRYDPHAVGDGGRSLGLFQLWTGWAAWYGVQVDALFDPATNAAVARAVFEHRGRWGGAGGWTCADILGIW